MEDQLGFWRKGPWTADEDLLLIEHVKLHGEGRWNSVARLTGLRRNAKSCRLRWVNYLRPDLKRGRITPHEERTILELHARWGNRWSTIARSLPGRTDNEIKNYWRTHFKTKGKTTCEDSTKLKARLLKRQKFQQEQQKQVLLHQQEKMNQEEMKNLLLNMLEESDNKVVASRYQESVHQEIQSVLYSHQQMVELESSMNSNEDFVLWDYGLWSLEDVGTTEGCVQMHNLSMPMPMPFF